MTDYSTTELRNELAQLFRVQLAVGSEGGTLNTEEEYAQLLEFAATTFFFHPGAVFYLAQMAANLLRAKVTQEVAVLEDLLVSLEDLKQVGSPVRNATSLSNARTAAVSLEAATTVSGRPELGRFTKQIDRVASDLRGNLISISRGNVFARTREDARGIARRNLTKLEELHSEVLSRTLALRDMVDEYEELDIPSRVSSTVLSSINTRLKDNIDFVLSSSDSDNLAANRGLFLALLTDKVAVQLLNSFTAPLELKYRSPNRPIPSGLTHRGRAAGVGTAASVTFTGGPWTYPISADLTIEVSGGAAQTLDLPNETGASLDGNAQGPFFLPLGATRLHVILDPDSYEITAQTGSTTTLIALNATGLKLGFKHAASTLINLTRANDPGAAITDWHPRRIVSLPVLLAFTDSSFDDVTGILSVPAASFTEDYVGLVIGDTNGATYEITQYISSTSVRIDTRSLTVEFLARNGDIRGILPTSSGNLEVSPAFATAITSGEEFEWSPATATAEIPIGWKSRSTVGFIIEAETGSYRGHDALWRHAVALGVPEDDSRLRLACRSAWNPYLQIGNSFLVHDDTAPPAAPTILQDSAHGIFGFRLGQRLDPEYDTNDFLSPEELRALISGNLTGVTASISAVEELTGTVTTVWGTTQVQQTAVDWEALGVEAGQILELRGVEAGKYFIESVNSASSITLRKSETFDAVQSIDYAIFRQEVTLALADASFGSSLNITETPSEFGVATGIRYSVLPEFEAVTTQGEALSFDGVEAGDLLRLAGSSEEYDITEVNDTRLTIDGGLPSNLQGYGFEIMGSAARGYETLSAQLQTFTTSPTLLKKNSFDSGVEKIVNAVTRATLPGLAFIATINQAQRLVAELMALLSTNFTREGEYSVTIPGSSYNLEDILRSYTASKVSALDHVIDMFLSRRYERAAKLLRRGSLADFFATTEETGSFSGAVLKASRDVLGDLPLESSDLGDVESKYDRAVGLIDSDEDDDFSDIEAEPEDADL